MTPYNYDEIAKELQKQLDEICPALRFHVFSSFEADIEEGRGVVRLSEEPYRATLFVSYSMKINDLLYKGKKAVTVTNAFFCYGDTWQIRGDVALSFRDAALVGLVDLIATWRPSES